MAHSADSKKRRESSSAADEITPLLASTSHDPAVRTNEAVVVTDVHSNGHVVEEHEKPLPMTQIFLLCIARVVDPISFFSIFPFAPAMVKSMNIDEKDVGFYTGLIESIFSIVQMFTMVFWGRIADRHGRKPVLVVCLVGLSISVTLFGVSKAIWQMIFFRAMAGLFSGSVVTIRAMFSELSTPSTQARAFSFFAFAGNIGIFAGPIIGALANPANQYPRVFVKIQFFHDWPYILPCLVAGVFCSIATVTTALFVNETLQVEPTEDHHQNGQANGAPPTKAEPMSSWEVLKSPGVPITLALFGYAGLLGFAFTAVAPVYWFTSVRLGGFGFEPNMISLFFSISGISQALWLLVAFPLIQRRIGTGALLRLCGAFWPILMCFFPLGNFFLKHSWKAIFWTVTPTFQVLGSGVAMAFTGVQLALNDVSPSPQTLGTLNALGLTLNSAIRAVTPALFSSLYAFGVKEQILSGQLGIVVLIFLAAGFWVTAQFLPEKVQGSPLKKRTDQGEDCETEAE